MKALMKVYLTDQWKDIIEDKEIDIVVEVMGGIEPAKTIITEALKAGKNVVTAAIRICWQYVVKICWRLQESHHVDLMFEAAVAGGSDHASASSVSWAGNEIRQTGYRYCQWYDELYSDENVRAGDEF